MSANYRAAHEPERAETLDLILREARGELSAPEVRTYLRDRDARLDLDYDVAWADQFIVDHLLAVFPEATFIVLIRDCHTWLQSIAGHLVGRATYPATFTRMSWAPRMSVWRRFSVFR